MKNLLIFTATLIVLGIFALTGIAQVVVFEDDFSKDLGKWKVLVEDKVNGTKWQVRSGFLDSGNGDNNPEPLAITAGNMNWVDVALESDATVTDGGQGTGYFYFAVRFKDTNNYYAMRYITGTPGSLDQEGLGGLKKDNPELWIVKRVNGKYTRLASVGAAKPIPNVSSGGVEFKGKFVRFKLEVRGNSLKGFIDSVKGYELFLEATDNELKQGAIALGQQEYAASFDNVKVTDLSGVVAVSPWSRLATTWGEVKGKGASHL